MESDIENASGDGSRARRRDVLWAVAVVAAAASEGIDGGGGKISSSTAFPQAEVADGEAGSMASWTLQSFQ
jgi:hypothetical protein